MAKYRTTQMGYWNDPYIERLSKDGKEEVKEEVIESHLSCLFESGSESGFDGGAPCSRDVD